MRRIIHLDIDAFFASVEQIDFPEYKNKPLIVGGDSDRGVVATCSYEARKYGVKSAMSIVVAKKLCPQGIFISGNMRRYSEISKRIFRWIRSEFEHIEIVSIDEAYIDITYLDEPAEKIARYIKKAIYELTGLTISVGISYNKFLAKIASDWNKPDGIFVIDDASILLPLPIIRIHGLGKKTCEKLNNIGIFTIDDLSKYPKTFLNEYLGESYANEIFERINGIDNRPVLSSGERKSYGKEITLEEDISDRKAMKKILDKYLIKLQGELVSNNVMAKTMTIKIKYYDFKRFTRSFSMDGYTDNNLVLKKTLDVLYNQIEFTKPVRLIGLTLSNLQSQEAKQYNIWEVAENTRENEYGASS